MEVINYLLGYHNLHIVQDSEMFHFSLDSVLLPNFVTIPKKANKILDIGCGNAPIPLILSTMTSAHITGVEIQPIIYEQAIKSVQINNLEKQIDIVHMDINDYAAQQESDQFDVITCNPPFFKVQEKSHFNKNDYKTLARHEVSLTLEQLLAISRKLLKNGGIFGMVHRPERLLDILEQMRKNNIEPKRMRLIYPYPDCEANILLIEGKKNGKPGLKILPPLYTHEKDGSYTKEVELYFEEGEIHVAKKL